MQHRAGHKQASILCPNWSMMKPTVGKERTLNGLKALVELVQVK